MRGVALVALLAAGCDAAAEQPTTPEGDCGPLALPVAVEVGTTAADQSGFTPFGTVGLLPITAGFQGLVFVSFALRSEERLPPRMEASMRLLSEDGTVLLPATKTALFFEAQPDGSAVDPTLLLLLDPPLISNWNGVRGRLEVRVYGGSRCALLSQQVELTDRGGCFMDESGAILCAGEGG